MGDQGKILFLSVFIRFDLLINSGGSYDHVTKARLI
jgi:hypothetical protein